jgi:RimJ/RimL family protein N-acetyltransferase
LCGFRICLVSPRAFGRGFGTEATRLILAHTFDTVGANRIELEVFDFNPRRPPAVSVDCRRK